MADSIIPTMANQVVAACAKLLHSIRDYLSIYHLYLLFLYINYETAMVVSLVIQHAVHLTYKVCLLITAGTVRDKTIQMFCDVGMFLK